MNEKTKIMRPFGFQLQKKNVAQSINLSNDLRINCSKKIILIKIIKNAIIWFVLINNAVKMDLNIFEKR